MIIDTTVSLGNLITLAVFVLGAVSAFITLRMTVRSNNAGISSLANTLKNLNDSHEKTARRVEEVRSKAAHELAEMRLEMAKNYATVASIEGVEKRIIASIQRLENRLDRTTENTKKHTD